MEIEATTTEIILPPAAPTPHNALDGGGFGSRWQPERPHSISLFGTPQDGARKVATRGADVLLGVGIGAALMYYLDRERGAYRRGALGAALGDLALTVITRVTHQSAERERIQR